MNKFFKILCVSLTLLSLNISAETDKTVIPSEEIEAKDFFSFSCLMPEDQAVHRFLAMGYVGVSKDGDVLGSISIQMIKGNEIRSVIQFSDVSASGLLETFEETENSKAFQVLTLSTSIPYIRSINIIFKDSPLASNILSIDNFNYRSDCKINR